MKWEKKDQMIFECADKALIFLRRLGWLTTEEYEEIHTIIDKAIKSKDGKND